MRPEDETPDNESHDEDAPAAGDIPESPPPATWAGRQRSAPEGEPGGEAPQVPDEPEATPEDNDARGEEDEEVVAEESLEVEVEVEAGDEVEAEDEEDEEDEHLDEDERAVEEDVSEEAEDADDEEADDAEADDAAPAASVDTVEAETLALADREEAEEAALAGLRARTAQHEAKLPTPTPTPTPTPAEAAEPAEAAPVAAATAGDDDGKTPRARPLWARFLAASLLIVVSMAAATSIALLNELTDFAKGLSDNDALASLRDQLEEVEGGDPQTLLILGSDKRLESTGDPGRSDTAILLRVDPDKDAIALLSIPRDLKVTIPTVGQNKFNAAYSAGGPDLTLEVVKRLTGLDIHHVVNINFTGFADAVNAIGCVYVDVDRRYYIPPESGTSEIDLEAGYQRMCGYNALQYVRFRHFDNDLVRAARQQDFLREARQKLTPGTLVGDAEELLGIFTEYTTSDIGDGVTLLELMKTFLQVQSAPVNEVHFPAELGDGTSGYVEASNEAIDKAVDEFMGVEGTPGARPGGESENEVRDPESGGEKPGDGKGDGAGGKGDDKPEQDFVGPEMQDSTGEGKIYAHQFSIKKRNNGEPMIDFPILYPTRLVPGSFIARDSRAFIIDGGDKEEHYGYKFVASVPGAEFGNGLQFEYYGISGTDWLDAPILDNPSETRTIDGREYELFYDGDRLRLVGFKTNNGAYWVNNTLSQSLEEGEMLSIATSMREFGD